ncbi:MAG: hypothetical protein ACO1SV_05030 [Fimbriimonas sp.]
MNVRTVVRIATLGALWGVIEMTLGAAMHAAHVPFLGTWLTAIGICIALVGAHITKKPGTVLGIAVIAALLKLFSFGGGAILSAMIAITIEGALAELGLRMFRYKGSAASFATAMTLAIVWDVAHPVLVGGLLMGRGVGASYQRFLGREGKILGLDPSWVLAVVAALVAFRIVIGIVSGLIAWSIARAVAGRTQAPSSPS